MSRFKPEAPHGTLARYRRGAGCRCDLCRKANAAEAMRRKPPKTREQRHSEYRAWHERNPLYAIWRGMRHRCFKPTHHEFHRYGGRGIRIHAPWAESYERFASDVTAEIGPRLGLLTIDRIDNNGNYEPGNVRWLSRSGQSANRQNAYGESQGLAVLTEDSVYVIRRIAALDLFTKQQIATWWGVGRSTLGHVLNRKTWRHVP